MTSKFRGLAVIIGIFCFTLCASATTTTISPTAVWVSGREDIVFSGSGYENGYNCSFKGLPTLDENVAANVTTNGTNSTAACKSPDFSFGYTSPVNVTLKNKAGEAVTTITLTILDTRTREASCAFPYNSTGLQVTTILLKQVGGNTTLYSMNNTNVTNTTLGLGNFVFHVHQSAVTNNNCTTAGAHFMSFGQTDIPNNGAAQSVIVTNNSVSVNVYDNFTQLHSEVKTGVIGKSIVVHDSTGTPTTRYACCNIQEVIQPTVSATIAFSTVNISGTLMIAQEPGKKAKIQLNLLKTLDQAYVVAVFDSCTTGAQYPSSKYPVAATFNKGEHNGIVEANDYFQLSGYYSVIDKSIAVFKATDKLPLKLSDMIACGVLAKSSTAPSPAPRATPVSGASSLQMAWVAFIFAFAFFWVSF
jgi:hypothetical protein